MVECQPGTFVEEIFMYSRPRKNPINANGMAKMV
jgi:hypothetical protein